MTVKRIALMLFTFVLAISCGRKPCNCSDDRVEVKPVPLPEPPAPNNCDDVYGSCVNHVGSWRVNGATIERDGRQTRIVGINWFGLETDALKLHGLWTGRKLEEFVDQVAELKFNSIRVPLAPEVLDESLPGSDGYSSPKAQLVSLIEYADSKGISILLDLHKCSRWNTHLDKPGPGVGVCWSYSEERWTSDLVKLAKLAEGHSNVIGIDLFNEPYGLRWEQWRGMSERAGQAILKANPRLLIFVEGVGNEGGAGKHGAFWGENLYDAGRAPVRLPASRLVYSPHVYGPSVAGQSYFNVAAFPSNMPEIWREHWAHLIGKAPTVIGEWGGRNVGNDATWQAAFTSFLKSSGAIDAYYWCLNPNSGDTGGILRDDWRTVDQAKYDVIRRLYDL